jgi:hypothetical protein
MPRLGIGGESLKYLTRPKSGYVNCVGSAIRSHNQELNVTQRDLIGTRVQFWVLF